MLPGRDRFAVGGGEAAVHIFQIRYLIIESLKVEARIHVDAALVADGVAHFYAVGEGDTPVPVIRRSETEVGTDPVGDGEFVERKFIGGVERLLEVDGAAERQQAAAHSVLPGGIFVRI